MFIKRSKGDMKARLEYLLRVRLPYGESPKDYIETARKASFISSRTKTYLLPLEQHQILEKFLRPIYDFLKPLFKESES